MTSKLPARVTPSAGVSWCDTCAALPAPASPAFPSRPRTLVRRFSACRGRGIVVRLLDSADEIENAQDREFSSIQDLIVDLRPYKSRVAEKAAQYRCAIVGPNNAGKRLSNLVPAAPTSLKTTFTSATQSAAPGQPMVIHDRLVSDGVELGDVGWPLFFTEPGTQPGALYALEASLTVQTRGTHHAHHNENRPRGGGSSINWNGWEIGYVAATDAALVQKAVDAWLGAGMPHTCFPERSRRQRTVWGSMVWRDVGNIKPSRPDTRTSRDCMRA